MQISRRISHRLVVVGALSMAATALMSSQGFGQSVSSTVTATSDVLAPVVSSYDINFGFKPQYFEDSGQYVEQMFGLGFSPSKNTTLNLYGFVYSRWEPERATELGDTLIRLTNRDLVKVGAYSLASRVTGKLPTSPAASEAGLRGRGELRVTNKLTFGSLALLHHLTGQKYLYQETLNKDGVSNRDYEIRNSMGLSLVVAKKLTLAVSSGVTNRFMHVGQRRDLVDSSVDVSFAFNDNVSASAGILTSQAQIEDGRRQAVRLFEKDITEAYSGLSFLF